MSLYLKFFNLRQSATTAAPPNLLPALDWSLNCPHSVISKDTHTHTPTYITSSLCAFVSSCKSVSSGDFSPCLWLFGMMNPNAYRVETDCCIHISATLLSHSYDHKSFMKAYGHSWSTVIFDIWSRPLRPTTKKKGFQASLVCCKITHCDVTMFLSKRGHILSPSLVSVRSNKHSWPQLWLLSAISSGASRLLS